MDGTVVAVSAGLGKGMGECLAGREISGIEIGADSGMGGGVVIGPSYSSSRIDIKSRWLKGKVFGWRLDLTL